MSSKKTKIYLDTSILNLALETSRIEYPLTKEFLKRFSFNRGYKLLISDLVMYEIDKAKEPRKADLSRLILSYDIDSVDYEQDAYELAQVYLNENLLPKKAQNDALHIAIATLNQCDFIVSWNFKHIVRAKTIKSVHLINFREGYKLIEIVSPREFLET